METIKLIALLILISFILISCSQSPEKMLSYQEKPFRALLTWQTNGASFIAVMTSYPASDTLTIEFTSPASVSGITVKKSAEQTTVTLDGIEITAPELSRFASIAKFFNIDGSITKSSVTSISGAKANYIEILDASKEKYRLYLYSASGLPRRIEGELYGKQITLDFISFEPIPE